ncbi:unnamed protein product [Meganyctiphanes norvegica]|uniref:Protein sleepless n=1 Tax=Meganyctiphanes norvegica TaxID=48144 RepID=A0AAV2R648_MEGNR
MAARLMSLFLMVLMVHGSLSIKCYQCTSFEGATQDENCANDGYDGNTKEDEKATGCFTGVRDSDGLVLRKITYSEHTEGDCVYNRGTGGLSWTGCFCTSDLCNSNLCKVCPCDPSMEPNTDTTEGSADA